MSADAFVSDVSYSRDELLLRARWVLNADNLDTPFPRVMV